MDGSTLEGSGDCGCIVNLSEIGTTGADGSHARRQRTIGKHAARPRALCRPGKTVCCAATGGGGGDGGACCWAPVVDGDRAVGGDGRRRARQLVAIALQGLGVVVAGRLRRQARAAPARPRSGSCLRPPSATGAPEPDW